MTDTLQQKAASIQIVNGKAEHARLLHTIFAGVNTRKYSPVSGSSLTALAQHLESSGTAFVGRAPHYRVFGQSDAKLFGTFILKNIDWKAKTGEIGFSLLDECQGQGLGPALVYACVQKIFADSILNELWATVSENNYACQKLMDRVGLRSCGQYREAFRIQGKMVPQLVYRLSRQDV